MALHALMGAALGRACRTRGQAIAAGAISHLAADALPHCDLEVREEAVLLGGVLGVIGVSCGVGSREFAGAVGAALPDVENLVGRALGIPDSRLLLPTHRKYHGRKTSDLRGQAALALVSAAALVALRGRCAAGPERGNC